MVAGGTTGAFDHPDGIAYMPDGRIAVADTHNRVVKVISCASGRNIPQALVGELVTSVFAGRSGFNGDTDGSLARARFQIPGGIAVDTCGRVAVAEAIGDFDDPGYLRLRVIDPKLGTTTTLPLVGDAASASICTLPLHVGTISIDNNGDVWVANESGVHVVSNTGLSAGYHAWSDRLCWAPTGMCHWKWCRPVGDVTLLSHKC
jgi:hypothetical protein